MNNELKELYQEVIIDHNKSPRNFRKIENADHFAEGYNPLCGDKIDIYMKIENEKIKDLSFVGSGCAISKASASIMTDLLKNKSVEESRQMFDQFHDLVTGKITEEPEIMSLGKIAVFAGVREFPTRVKCATLSWHTMLSALKKEKEIVSTE